MANKSAIDAIFADITTGGANTAVEALACWNALKNELYSDDVADTQITQNYTTKTGTNINYSMFMKKVGNNVFMKVTVTNATSSALSPQWIFDWKNNEYQPKAGAYNQYLEAKILGSGNSTVLLFLNSTGLRLASALPQSSMAEVLSFEFYIAKN